MKRFDYNRDGEISEEEIYRVLAPYKSTNNKQMRSLSPVKLATTNNKMAMS
jgi:Ca2+-binding EF-hand superfamily protein